MTPQTQNICDIAVRQVAHYYSNSCWWAEFEDLYQQGWLIAAEVLGNGTYEQDRLGGYIRVAVSRRLSRYCWDQSCPVSANQPGKQLAGLHRCQLEFAPVGTVDFEFEILAAEAATLVPELRASLRTRLAEIYAVESTIPAPNPQLSACLDVLVNGEKPKKVADKHAINVREVYYTTYWMKRSASKDDRVRTILGQLVAQRENLHEYQWDN